MKKRTRNILITVAVIFFIVFAVCVGFLIYCGIMTSYTAYTDDGTYEAIPEELTKQAEEQGTIVCIEYETSTYFSVEAWDGREEVQDTLDDYLDREDEALTKEIYVYLPYGYEESGSEQYNILYHIHGTTCDGTTLINGVGKDSDTKRLLDNMIEQGLMEPTIVVFPTWYNGNDIDDDNPDYLINHFGTEMQNDIMPVVEKTYRTYAGLTDDMSEEEIQENLIASRDHRAVSGYSRGGSCTWNLFAHMPEYFYWYIPISGEYKCELEEPTKEKCQEKVVELEELLEEKDYGPDDFYIYSAVGALDFAYGGVHMQFLTMLEHPEMFTYGENAEEGNFYLCSAPKLWHGDTMSPKYLYNALQVVFH